jgi:hypothetical protein
MNKEEIVIANSTNWSALTPMEMDQRVNELMKSHTLDEKLKSRESLLEQSMTGIISSDDLEYCTMKDNIHFSKAYIEGGVKVTTLAVIGTHLETVQDLQTLISKLRRMMVSVSVDNLIKKKTQIKID